MRIVLAAALLAAMPAGDEEYWPTKKGMEWTYVWEDKKVDVVTSEGTKEIDGVEYVVFAFDVQDHAAQRKEYARVTKEGVCYAGQDLGTDEEDDQRENLRLMVKFGGKKGDAWTWKLDEYEAKYEHQGEEEVSVPAGKYKAIRIAFQHVLAGTKSTTTQWYAKGVGLVKEERVSEGSKSTMELKRVKG